MTFFCRLNAHLFLIFTVCVLSPLSALADQHCDTISTLSRLHGSQPLFDRTAQNGNNPAPLGSLQSDLNRIDADGVAYALRNLDSPRDIQALTKLADTTAQIADLARAGDADAVRTLMQSPQTTAIFRDATSVLSRLTCPTGGEQAQNAVAPANADDGNGLNQDGIGPLTGPQLVFEHSVLLVSAISLIALALMLAFWARQKRREHLRRRGHRFPVNRPVGYHFGNRSRNGRMLDISGLGSKLKHSGELENAVREKITIIVHGRPISGQIVWANEHYAGIRFHRPFPRAQLRQYISNPRIRGKEAA